MAYYQITSGEVQVFANDWHGFGYSVLFNPERRLAIPDPAGCGAPFQDQVVFGAGLVAALKKQESK